jgi:hypothetical protein
MRFPTRSIGLAGCILAVAACARDAGTVTAPSTITAASSIVARTNQWGPESPPFNLEVVLRGDGFGLVRFRQPNDGELVIHLDTWVRGLEPNTSYVLERAVDSNPDGVCTGTAWLTLGKGLVPQAITTDDRGTGRESLFRSVAAFGVGPSFDIQFRLVNVATGEVVLTSSCYQYTITQ